MQHSLENLRKLVTQKPTFFFPAPVATQPEKEGIIYAADVIKFLDEAKEKSVLLNLAKIIIEYDSMLLAYLNIKTELTIYYTTSEYPNPKSEKFLYNQMLSPQEIKAPIMPKVFANGYDHEIIETLNKFKENESITGIHIE